MYDIDVLEIIKRLNGIDNSTLLLSNPCIELWFLLHYKNQTASINCKKCFREMSNRNSGYKKATIDKTLKERLTEKREVAVKRAKALAENNNPSSTVYKLIDILDKLKEVK